MSAFDADGKVSRQALPSHRLLQNGPRRAWDLGAAKYKPTTINGTSISKRIDCGAITGGLTTIREDKFVFNHAEFASNLSTCRRIKDLVLRLG